MPRRPLPCDDPGLAAKRAQARERMARMAERRRADEQQMLRVTGSVITTPVTCPRCGSVFGGVRPLLAYALHRSERCPWRDATEKAEHDALVTARRNALSSDRLRGLRAQGLAPKRKYTPKTRRQIEQPSLPLLHTGHVLFERARAARHSWPDVADKPLAYPIYEDMLSEAVLALLEERDPAKAMRAFRRKEGPRMISLYLEVEPGIELHETLAA